MRTTAKAKANPATTGDYDRVRELLQSGGLTPRGDLLSTGVYTDTADLLQRWCGLSAPAAVAALSQQHRLAMLARSTGILAAPRHPRHQRHIMVKHRVLSPGPVAARGEGLSITYGFHASPFGDMLLLAVDGAMIGAAFRNDDARETRDDTLADMRRRWPVASYVHDAGQGKRGATAALARLMFEPGDAKAPGETLRLALIGSAFDVRVWEALLLIPIAAAVTYRALAMHLGKPTAARAIGSAVGRNPISFTVPCHRVLRGDGALGGYHWGLTRKRAMLCWEAGHNI